MAGFDVKEIIKVGPGSLISKMMRQYWIPAGKSSELVAGGSPLRVLLLGEKLLAFREPSGEIGIIDHVCPHRGASLFYGRNEQGGVRCAYHGWKFNRSGACIDTPNVPVGRPRPKIKTTAYRATEGNGMFWVYMGDREVPPPLPIFAHHDLDAVFIVRDCNWLQALEGNIDTAHVGFLHLGGMELEDLPDGHPSRIRLMDRAPEFEVCQTAWGNMSGAYRDVGAAGRYWSLAHFLFPFWTITANDMPFSMPWLARGWVPLDDTHTMLITMLDKNFALPPGMFNKQGITPQDQAITESQGPIQDRSLEHLVPSDAMIVRTRRLIQKAAEEWVEQGVVPPRRRQSGSVLRCAGRGAAVRRQRGFRGRVYARSRAYLHLQEGV